LARAGRTNYFIANFFLAFQGASMPAYQKLCTQFYDIDKPGEPAGLDFYLGYANEAKGPIWEPMCGSGRFLIPLLKRGFDIEGTDASPFMLQACRERCKDLGLSARVYEQWLDQTQLPRQYGLVFIPSESFRLITEPLAIKESLKRVHAALLPGGKFVFDIERYQDQESSSWPWGGRWIERPDGAKIVISWMGHFDAKQRISHSLNRYELFKDGKLLETELEDFHLRQYTFEEIKGFLEAAGFGGVRMLKAHEQRAPEEKDASIVVECVKA
jgi:ubiquinone/menaquinone biosynthesis C-methylase UbiE